MSYLVTIIILAFLLSIILIFALRTEKQKPVSETDDIEESVENFGQDIEREINNLEREIEEFEV